jgi:Spy/CpxP family protein refolding chaperone
MQKSLCNITLIGVLALGMAAVNAHAQDSTQPPAQTESGHMGANHRGMDPDQQLKHLTKELSLTADQQSQIKPLLESSHQQMQQLHEDQALSREDRMTKMKGIMDDTHTKIEAVLNDQQKQKFEAMMQRREEHMHGGNAPQ